MSESDSDSDNTEFKKLSRTGNKILKVCGKTLKPFSTTIKIVRYKDIGERFDKCQERKVSVPVCVAAEVANQVVRKSISAVGLSAMYGGSTLMLAPEPFITKASGAALISSGAKIIYDSDNYGNALAEKIMNMDRKFTESEEKMRDLESKLQKNQIPFYDYGQYDIRNYSPLTSIYENQPTVNMSKYVPPDSKKGSITITETGDMSFMVNVATVPL